MEKTGKKKNMKASDSAPMPTKQIDDGSVKNQTTSVPRTQFPWVTVALIIALLLIVLLTIFFAGAD